MEESRFQLDFGWKEFIVFIFFSLVSFSSIFFLGFIQGKNQLINTKVVSSPLKEQQLQAKELINDSESLLLKQKFTSSKKEKITETKKKEDKTVFAKTEKKTTQQNTNLLAKNKYVVQLIAYGNKNMAEKLQKKLKDSFFPAYISTTELNDKTYYRVRVGSYSLNDAQKISLTIQQKYPTLEKMQIFKIN